MKTVFFCALLILQSSFPLYAQHGGETVTVEVQGIGKDAQSAEKNALYSAVEHAVGAYLDNETVVKNEEVIHDKLLTVAQGFVQKYEVLVPAKERKDGSGIWEIKIRAVVRKSDVGAALRAAGVMQMAADGTAAWAAQITKLKSREDAMALLEKVIPEIPRNLVLCSLVQDGAQIQTKEDPETGDLLAIMTVRMEVNLDWWSKEVVPALDAALTALKLNTSETTVSEFAIAKFQKHHSSPNIFESSVVTKPTNVYRYYENYLEYHPEELRRLMPVKDFSLILPEKIIVREAVGGYGYSSLPDDSFPRNETDVLLNIAHSSTLLQFKKYSLPSNYVQSISQLIEKAFSQNGFGDAEVLHPAFIVVLMGENKDEILHRADFYFPEVLGITAIYPVFAPLFEFKGVVGVSSHSLTAQAVVQLELPVDAGVLKQTKRVDLLAGRYGVRKSKN